MAAYRHKNMSRRWVKSLSDTPSVGCCTRNQKPSNKLVIGTPRNFSTIHKPHNLASLLQSIPQKYMKDQEAISSPAFMGKAKENDEEPMAPMEDQAQNFFQRKAPIKQQDLAKLRERQLALETRTFTEACTEYRETLTSLISMGRTSGLRPMEKQIVKWFDPMRLIMEEEIKAIKSGEKSEDRAIYGPLLSLVKPERLAVITLQTCINLCMKEGTRGVPFVSLCSELAQHVEAQINLEHLESKLGRRVISRLNKSGQLSTRKINLKARKALETGVWPPDVKAKVGGCMVNLLLNSGLKDGVGQDAFRHVITMQKMNQRTGFVALSPALMEMLLEDGDEDEAVVARHLPMLTKPKPWTSHDSGGFLRLKVPIMRVHGSQTQVHTLRRANMPLVYESLNALASQQWTVNPDVLDVVETAWDQQLTVGELPSQTDYDLPAPLSPEEQADSELATQHYFKTRRIAMRNGDLHSLRCDTNLKLNIAKEFRDEVFYFPYNMDFRGRAYPIPPNLNHVGSDLCRGLLRFKKELPLGERGLFWLKVQLANLYGFDKASFSDRADWVEEHIHEVYDSALKPLDGNRWWATADSPFQTLSVCQELVKVFESGNPREYKSAQPVHMDGSCNGLQHYAALGRDEEGGRQVNLVAGDKPGDVYSGVCAIVARKIAEEVGRELPEDAPESERHDHEMAILVNGLIDRKVVKQTVMTSVYGVTFAGARKQIQGKLYEKLLETGMSEDQVEKHAYQASHYVATITMHALRELFTGARNIMDWLGNCARLVAIEGEPMSWVTPLGLPVVQPYRSGGSTVVKTVVQTVSLILSDDDANISVGKQRSAFPPNFVHSLDSTHMLLTALRMRDLKVDFTSVHDSYWTHPAHVDLLNENLRDCFVDLYSKPILEDLLEDLRIRFPGIDFPEIPERGSLDLAEVRKSPYFFN